MVASKVSQKVDSWSEPVLIAPLRHENSSARVQESGLKKKGQLRDDKTALGRWGLLRPNTGVPVTNAVD